MLYLICNTFDYFKIFDILTPKKSSFDSDKMESEWHSRVYVNERD